MPINGYQYFCNQIRNQEKQKLEDEKGRKVAVAELMKHLATKWQGLGTEEKQKFADLAKSTTTDANDHQNNQQKDQKGGGFPTSTIKKIILSDKDISRIAGECTTLMALLGEHFLEHLAVDSAEITKRGKRSTIKAEDIKEAVKLNKRISRTGVSDVLAEYEDVRLHSNKTDKVQSQSITKFLKKA
eukprot:TRINITY_DN4921_c0_g1_i1.p2 TRINITY_DN4921_c0_g1~~TRINITY_DN4921_c0_g1_i1.p2  ORF type:complete len:186 (+),score=23.50 TRINITY_DN4921_c0_g1_i1:167-724(+)